MLNQRKTLQLYILIEIGLIASYRVVEYAYPSSGVHFWKDVFYLVPLSFGIFAVYYSYNIRCKKQNCNAKQVFRGWSIFDLAWPNSKCYRCGEDLNK